MIVFFGPILDNMNTMDRRSFIIALAAGASARTVGAGANNQNPGKERDKLGEVLPQRPLGKSGQKVTMLGIGGYHVGWTEEKHAPEIIESALDEGIRFFDNAESYQDGESERRYGKYLNPKYRDHIFLMTKTLGRDAKSARKNLEESLRRLNTDHLDLWQIHSVTGPEDVDSRLDKGVLDVVMKAKEEGKVRHAGFTGHSNPEAHMRMLERTRDLSPFDTCQMPVNVVDSHYHSFIEQVLPELQNQEISLLAMKTLADGRFFASKSMRDRNLWRTDDPLIPQRLTIRDALFFVWSLPVSVLITGAENAALVREKADLARSFMKLPEAERNELIEKVADMAGGDVEYYKSPV